MKNNKGRNISLAAFITQGKEVTIAWGKHKGKKGRKEPVVFRAGKDNLPPGTRIKINTCSTKYGRQVGVVCEHNENDYLVGVKLDNTDQIT